MAVYLIHSDVELGSGLKGRAQHYLGWAEEWRLWQRLSAHAVVGSTNPAIIRAFLSHGANLRLVRVWPDGGKDLERYLKNNGQNRRLCPICSHHHQTEEFPLLATIRLLTQTYGRLPSVERLKETTTKIVRGTGASRVGRYRLSVTPLSRTSSVGVVVSRDGLRPGGRPTSAPALQPSEASSSASTRLAPSSDGGNCMTS